jgi:L-cysteate sulfo-lyase
LVRKTADKLKLPEILRDKVLVDDNYVGEGYGIPTDGTIEAITLLAQTEGILLDPVYSGKGMAGLIDLIRKGVYRKEQRILFLHTGGSAALFAYERELFIS